MPIYHVFKVSQFKNIPNLIVIFIFDPCYLEVCDFFSEKLFPLWSKYTWYDLNVLGMFFFFFFLICWNFQILGKTTPPPIRRSCGFCGLGSPLHQVPPASSSWGAYSKPLGLPAHRSEGHSLPQDSGEQLLLGCTGARSAQQRLSSGPEWDWARSCPLPWQGPLLLVTAATASIHLESCAATLAIDKVDSRSPEFKVCLCESSSQRPQTKFRMGELIIIRHESGVV